MHNANTRNRDNNGCVHVSEHDVRMEDDEGQRYLTYICKLSAALLRRISKGTEADVQSDTPFTARQGK